MATYAAISAVGQSLIALLEQARPKAGLEGLKVDLYQAANFKTPMEEGISLFLYRITPSTARRNLPGRTDAHGRRTLRPLPLDLYYLITPWARTATRQHLLLGWCLRTLEDTPTLTSSFLNDHGRPETHTFLPDETVTLAYEPLSIQDMLNVWEIGKPNIQISATYIARMVVIESTVAETELPRVQTRELEARRLERP